MMLIISLINACDGEESRIKIKNNESVMQVLLLGASVGKAWHFEELPERMKEHKFMTEFIAKYEPDKTDILERVLSREVKKPDVIMIKQCAAYFRSDSKVYDPLPVKQYKQLMENWVSKCRNENVVPVLATVVPITEKSPFTTKIKRLVKKYIMFKRLSPHYRDVRLRGVLEYNDWIKAYALEKQLIVLDLEAAVRISDNNRYLNPDLTTDGLHLNAKAYKRLDVVAMNTFKQIEKKLKAASNNDEY